MTLVEQLRVLAHNDALTIYAAIRALGGNP